MDLGISPKLDNLSPPYRLKPYLIEAVESAIRLAMERSKARIDMNVAQESKLTEVLEEELIKILQLGEIEHFSYKRFETPRRGEEHKDCTGERIEMRPDIKFAIRTEQLLEHRKYYAYFIECKIITDTSSVRLYADEGLQRFTDGNYAWSMTCSGMLGYVRLDAAHHEPKASLNAYFSKPNFGDERCRRQKLKAGPQLVEGTTDIIQTVHGRSFSLPNDRWEKTSKKPGSIAVRHLWLL